MIFIISGPSGCGKSSLLGQVIGSLSTIRRSVSFTTRKHREGESEGVDYFFVSTQKFRKMRLDGDFVEYASVYDNYYGTSKKWLEKQLEKHDKGGILLEIDAQGHRRIRALYGDVTQSIFILPPSIAALRQRLGYRALDNDRTVDKRMQSAQMEISSSREYDHLVLNDDFHAACEDLRLILSHQKPSATRRRKAQIIATVFP